MKAYERSRARLVRAGPTTTHVALDAWAHGQIIVRVDTEVMTTVTSLPRNRLAGVVLTAMVNPTATTEREADAHDWALLSARSAA
ncbi:hypothetical protein ABZ479_38365 [Streptomyces sp. NPDC005722]